MNATATAEGFLTREQAIAAGLPPEGPSEHFLTPDEAKAQGLPPDGPGSYDPSDPGKGIRDATRAGIRGVLDMVPFSHKFIAATQGEPVANVDQRYEAEKEANPGAFRTGQVGALLALPGPKGLKGMGALGAAQAAGDARGGFKDTLEQAGLGGAIGLALGGAGKLLAKPAAAALPWLQRLEAKFAQKIKDASVKPAEATLKSATGTLGALTAEGSRQIERLGMDAALPAAEQAANKAALASPEAEALATNLAQKARTKLPDQLARIQGGEGLVQQATADVAAAKTPQALADTEQRMRSYANDTLLKRYLLPGAAGAATGYVLGGDEGHGLGASTGLGLGLSARPMLRAIVRQGSNPGYAAPLTRKAVSITQKLAGLATSQPQMLGKFAGPLAHAASRGDDAVAATHYILAQDPEYQDLMHTNGDQQ